MISIFREVILLAITTIFFGQHAMADTAPHYSTIKTTKSKQNRRLLVRYKEGTSINKKDLAHFSTGAYVIESFSVPTNLELVEIARGISVDAALDNYRSDPNVLYAEPDYPVHALMQPLPTRPPEHDPAPPSGDPRYSEQWALNNIGQSQGIYDADINAPEMWEQIGGDRNVIIAVIDTGIDYNNPELRRNMWVNPGEIANNGIDDDNNGIVDDIHGKNALEETGDPMDDHGHGTHCAGVIGAEGNNNIGMRGIMSDVTIIGCKFLSSSGGGSTAGAISCLNYLRDLKQRSENSVNIFATSNSWGGSPHSQSLQDAIQEHQNLGILFIAAASNDGQDNDQVEAYPSNYPLANIVSVAATDHNDEKAYFSNYGKHSVHIAAPGVEILSMVLNGNFKSMSGTSMAAPHAAGLAGMIKAKFPDYNYIKVKNLLLAGGTPLESLTTSVLSGRRIRGYDQNGLGSLSCHNQIVAGRLSPTTNNVLVAVGEKVLLSTLNINCADPNGEIAIPMIAPDSRKIVDLVDNGKEADSAANDGMYTKEWIAERPGRYEFNFPGNDIVTVNVYDSSNMRAYAAEPEPQFNYRQIIGVPLYALDDWTSSIITPFPIKFGGEEQLFDSVTIGSNGAVSVTNTESIVMANTELPAEAYVSLIAPYWDDLNPADGDGDVYYATIGEAPHREFVIEWREVRHYNAPDTLTFQVVFFEDSSDVLFNYLDVDLRGNLSNGASATIGIQSTREKFTQVSFNTQSITSQTGLRFKLVP